MTYVSILQSANKMRHAHFGKDTRHVRRIGYQVIINTLAMLERVETGLTRLSAKKCNLFKP